MITTDFIPGSPCWLDLGAPDVPAAVDFDRSAFGWEFQPYGSEGDGYGAFQLDGKVVAAVGRLTEEGARSAWMIYFFTADADATAQTVQRLGGTVRVPPAGIGDEGRMAQFSDPSGGQFAVLQTGRAVGLEAADVAGSLSWIELCTPDAAASKTFYGGLFGWSTENMEMPGDGGKYEVVTPSGAGQDRMQGGIVQVAPEYLASGGGHAYWHPVFTVTDCDATVARVTKKGGSVQMGPEDVPSVGRLAVCLDPSGAEFVVLDPASD